VLLALAPAVTGVFGAHAFPYGFPCYAMHPVRVSQHGRPCQCVMMMGVGDAAANITIATTGAVTTA